jgi:hypothetical protein
MKGKRSSPDRHSAISPFTQPMGQLLDRQEVWVHQPREGTAVLSVQRDGTVPSPFIVDQRKHFKMSHLCVVGFSPRAYRSGQWMATTCSTMTSLPTLR